MKQDRPRGNALSLLFFSACRGAARREVRHAPLER